MTRRQFIRLLVLLPMVVVLSGWFRTGPLVNPDPIPVPDGLTMKDVRKAIKAGMVERGWGLEKDKPGEIIAVLHIRKHMAKVRIQYDTRQVRITYLDSKNLKYKKKDDGTEIIHKNYNGWVQNLAGDIRKALSKIALLKE